MENNRYKLSFVGASLGLRESLRIAETYLQYKDWVVVREQTLEDNLLQARTQSSAIRIYRGKRSGGAAEWTAHQMINDVLMAHLQK